MGIQVAPRNIFPTDTWYNMGSFICLFPLILLVNPLFCFELWYSSCFEVKCWFHTFPKRCSHIPMWILILHDNRDCHVNPFQPACFSSSGSDHFNICKIQSQLFVNGVCFIRSKLPLFSSPPTLVSSRIRISYSSIFLLMGSLSIPFPSMILPGVSHEDSNGASSSSFFTLFLLRWI